MINTFKTDQKLKIKSFLIEKYPSALNTNYVSDNFIVDFSEIEHLILDNDDLSNDEKQKSFAELFLLFSKLNYPFSSNVEHSTSNILKHGLTSDNGLFKIVFLEVFS